ncbi:hypothetical protein H4R35_004399 [Dimargaris xerosporica]|nr:hypothetical protein H4R35_004399 [Dimargaris xerosporica]
MKAITGLIVFALVAALAYAAPRSDYDEPSIGDGIRQVGDGFEDMGDAIAKPFKDAGREVKKGVEQMWEGARHGVANAMIEGGKKVRGDN